MIPVCEPTLYGNERKYVLECLDTNWISSNGRFIVDFEESFASFCNAKFAVSCVNGTAALHLALLAAGVGPGDEVILPSFTMIATCNAVLYCGATPVLVDSEPGTWNMDPGLLGKKVTKKTKAVIVVHTYGHPCHMDPIMQLAKEHDFVVIEDAAEAHGAEYKGRRVGGIGHIGCFSMYGNKILTCGEGGVCTTNNPEYAERMRSLRNHCFTKDRFTHEEIGYNYRLTNLQAAVALGQLEQAHFLVEKRIKNAKLYTKLLKNMKGVITPPEAGWAKNVYWMYGVLIDPVLFGMTATELRQELLDRGVDTRKFFTPMHAQPVYEGSDERFKKMRGKYPIAEMLGENGFYLPSSTHLTEGQIKEVVGAIRSAKSAGLARRHLND